MLKKLRRSTLTDMQPTTAIILAAGKGTRLRSVTGDEFPKPLTPLKGRPIIEYSILALRASGVGRILIGCGHLMESFEYLEQKYEEVTLIENPHYDSRASIYTFLMFEEQVKEAFYLLEADILYDPGIYEQLRKKAGSDNKIVTSAPLSLDDNVYFFSKAGRLINLTKEVNSENQPEGVMTGIWALSEGFLSRFSDYCNRVNIDHSEDYEIMLAQYSLDEEPIDVAHFPNLNWCEIDNEKHMEYALSQVLPNL